MLSLQCSLWPRINGDLSATIREGGAGLTSRTEIRSGQGRMEAGGRQSAHTPQTMHGQGLQEGRIAENLARAPMRPLTGVSRSFSGLVRNGPILRQELPCFPTFVQLLPQFTNLDETERAAPVGFLCTNGIFLLPEDRGMHLDPQESCGVGARGCPGSPHHIQVPISIQLSSCPILAREGGSLTAVDTA